MTTATETTPLHLHRLEISNFMRVEALTVDCDGRHVVISGPNARGKTSAVMAIWSALGGADARSIPEPIHRGANKAAVELDLGEYTVIRTWTANGTKLTITAKDGSKIRQPQQLLESLLGEYALDPVAFLDRRPQDQVDDVLAICGVKPPVDRVREITAEEHAARPGESADSYMGRLSADEVGLYYVRRREANRLCDQKRGALQEQEQVIEALGGPLKDGQGEQSASALLQEIELLQQQADTRRRAMDEAGDALREWQDATEQLNGLRTDQRRLEEKAKTIEAQLDVLKSELQKARAEEQTVISRIARGFTITSELNNDYHAKEKAAKALTDPAPEITNLRSKIGQVESNNRQFAKRQSAIEQLERLKSELDNALGSHKELDDTLESLRHLRRHLLEGVDLGVPGLEVGQGELRLDGVTFRQASQAQQIRVACAVACRQSPRLRLLRVDEGERLDSESRELLLRLANESGFQCILTQVRDGDGLKVEIIEGEK